MKFSKNLKFTILLPAAVLVIGLIVGIICGGMNLGIDFTGGTIMTHNMGEQFETADVEAVLAENGITDALVLYGVQNFVKDTNLRF